MLGRENDRGENSIMQTITVAVTVILVASGLMTVPNILVNAKDRNARVDISNLVFAEESVLANVGKYLTGFDSALPGSLVAESGIRVNLSGNVSNHGVVVCDSPQSYLIKATSASGKVFFRSSFASTISDDISRIIVPPCVSPDFYTTAPLPEIPVTPVNPTPTPTPTPTTPPVQSGYDDVSPLITIAPATASVTYTVAANSYNVLQIKLNNVNMANNSSEKQDWEIRIYKTSFPLNRFSNVTGITAEDSRVTCTDQGSYYSCKNNQTGQYGNGISSSSSFTVGIVVNATLAWVDNVQVSKAAATGGAWYATQQVTVSTTYPVYGYWKARVNFEELNAIGTNAPWLCVNDSNASITRDTGNWFWIQGSNDYFTIKDGSPRTFTVAKSTGNNGGCINVAS